MEKMGFDKTRVENGIAKLVAAQKKKAQGRMDSFFASAGEWIDLCLGFAFTYILHTYTPCDIYACCRYGYFIHWSQEKS